MAYIGIVSGFTAAPALCLVGVACLVLPVPQALQGSAGAFIILGALWTTLAILMTNFRSVGPHV